MKFVAGLLIGLMLLAALAGTVSGAEGEDICAVLFDFGNGRMMWADVPVEEGMSAFNLTVEAAEIAGLELQVVTDSPFGAYIDTIEGLGWNGVTSEFWGLSTWNSTTGSWASSMVGASSLPANGMDAIAWLYAPGGVSLATPEHRYPWTSFRHDALNSGMQAGEVLNPVLNWSKGLDNGAIDTSVIGANGLLYITTGGILNWTDFSYDSNGSVFCLDLMGDEVWKADIGPGYQVATPLLYGNMVIVPSADGKLYAFNAADGTAIWTYDTGSGATIGITSSPIAYLDRVIIAAGNGQLYSIYASNGTLHNSVPVASSIYSSSPALLDGVIYIGDDAGNVSAFAADGLSEMWSTHVGAKVRASPLIDAAKNQVVVTSTGAGGNITALNMTTGVVVWNTAIGGSSASAAMTSIGYVAATATDVIMVNFDGEKLWNCSLGATFGGAAPTVVGDMIFALTNDEAGRLVAVNFTGDMVSAMVLEPANYALCAPTFIGGFLYVASDNGKIYAFTTGTTDVGSPSPEAAPDGFPWLLVGGIIAIVIVAAVGLLYWNGKKGSA